MEDGGDGVESRRKRLIIGLPAALITGNRNPTMPRGARLRGIAGDQVLINMCFLVA